MLQCWWPSKGCLYTAFPVRLFYNRLTGNVQELDGIPQKTTLDYGANEVQRERSLFWLRQERLPMFKKSPLYSEYKLVKLLLRPLEDLQPVSRYGLRGYSRQTNSAALSTGQSSVAPQLLSAPHILPGSSSEEGLPFPTRVRSTPAAPGYESETYSLTLLEQYGDVIMRLYQLPDPPLQESEYPTPFLYSWRGEMDLQMISSTQTWTDPSALPAELLSTRLQDVDGMQEVEAESGPYQDWLGVEEMYDITEEEENFLKQNNLSLSSLQQLKEDALSSREGIAEFTDFLQGTLGIHLFQFWMDCEQFKEESADLKVNHSPEEARHRSLLLFRTIQKKFRAFLTPFCQEQIRLGQQNWGSTYQALRRSQYDALRRLRAYWIPRFLIHQQRSLRAELKKDVSSSSSVETPNIGASIVQSAMGKLGDAGLSVTLGRREDPDKVKGFISSQRGALWSQETPRNSLFDKMVPALINDNMAGGPFMYFLKRFEPPQNTQIFFLWQELCECGDWESDQKEQCHVTGHSPQTNLQSAVQQAGSGSVGRSDPEIGASEASPQRMEVTDWQSMYRLALAALCDPWLRFLGYDITMFLQYCAPITHKTPEANIAENKSLKAGQKRIGKENHQWAGTSEARKKKVRRRKDPLRLPIVVPGFPNQQVPEADAFMENLQDRAVYKAYRKVVQETEEMQTLKALEILHALQSDKGDRKVTGLVQKVLDLDIIQLPQLQGLKKHLAQELSKGQISDVSLEEVTLLLSSVLAPSFHKFWSEITGRLKDSGVELPGNDGWARLEPVMHALAAKMVLKRLHGRKKNIGHPAQMQPTVEDIMAFNRALQLAAEGWPTPEVLHFLRYLQTHGPEEELPLAENNLLCCLELQKYKNAHHAMPDCGLLRRKVQVIKERFLQPQANPLLQVASDVLERALKSTEAAALSEVPQISIFDEFRESLCDVLLPFWAGFRKTWLIRSPASAQKMPTLRGQQMLRKRLAMFELEKTPLRTFHLPSVQRPPEKRPPSVLTYSFSITHGITVKDKDEESRETRSPTPPAGRRRSQITVLPPINRSSPEQKQPSCSELPAIPELVSSH
ncbi:uncharacterized protein [Hyperolius riggenbachi]|uniref:uncharacterized protein isoform X2 n=1 Tax=Hyperolius riggenbachi TaxID=752182 RepID=UPI0035A2D04D